MRLVALCRAEEVREGAGRGFRLGSGPGQIPVFVIRKDGALYAYINRCPHVGTPLDWTEDQFFDPNGLLLCGTHGARFRAADGYCVSGPCFGKSLKPAPIRLSDGEILLEME